MKKTIKISEKKLTSIIENVIMESSTELTNMKKIVYFGLNYPNNFIEMVWADDPRMVDHYKNKFMEFYKKYGSMGVFSGFYTYLDNDAQMKLTQWILQNYKG